MAANKTGLKEFISEHPHVDLGATEACYASCCGEWAKDAFDAYDHVKSCAWCEKWMEEHEKLKEITKPNPKEVERNFEKFNTYMKGYREKE